MKQRFFLFVPVFALLIGVLVFSGAGSQAVAQQRPPGGDSIPVQPPSPDPGGFPQVQVQCNPRDFPSCGVECTKCGARYYSRETWNGQATSYRGICTKCRGSFFRSLTWID